MWKFITRQGSQPLGNSISVLKRVIQRSDDLNYSFFAHVQFCAYLEGTPYTNLTSQGLLQKHCRSMPFGIFGIQASKNSYTVSNEKVQFILFLA